MRTLVGDAGVLPRGRSEVAMPMVFLLAILTLPAAITPWAHGPLDLFRAEGWASIAELGVGLARHGRQRPAQRPE
jgi:hypothetical protein